jgi:hypothetical protein
MALAARVGKWGERAIRREGYFAPCPHAQTLIRNRRGLILERVHKLADSGIVRSLHQDVVALGIGPDIDAITIAGSFAIAHRLLLRRPAVNDQPVVGSVFLDLAGLYLHGYWPHSQRAIRPRFCTVRGREITLAVPGTPQLFVIGSAGRRSRLDRMLDLCRPRDSSQSFLGSGSTPRP